MTMKAEMIATGIVTPGITVARTEPTKAKITTRTSTRASASTFTTSIIDSSTNFEKSMLTETVMSPGRLPCRRATSASTRRLTSRMLAFDCGTTPRLMPDTWFDREKKRASSGSMLTSATSPSRTW